MSMIISAAIPGNPNKPEMAEVTRLIGTCRSIVVPNAFKKNNRRAPIITFTNICPTIRIGLTGAPTKSTRTINPPNIEITTIGSNPTPLLQYNLYY